MDLGLFPIYGTKPQAQTLRPEVQQMMKSINAVLQGNPTETQRKFVDLFWAATSDKNAGHDKEVPIQYRCIADTYGKAIADFLLGQVFLADDHAHGVTENAEKAVEYLGKAFRQGFKPAESSLIRLYSNAKHVSENRYLDVDIEFAGQVLAKAAQRDNPTAHFVLGALHLFMKESDRHFDHLTPALSHLKSAFELGHQEWKLASVESDEIKQQADLLWNSGNIFFNYYQSDAITLYKIAAASGNKEAQQKLAEINKPGLLSTFFENKVKPGPAKFDHIDINK